ncbi:uncharacterized protein LOC143535762 [Bidens hawaiensis]|uniref:uncharacterized protein LOC143535762 n=1 Tax=Bidens hawaiensis TaxID=980011 RepID=UPI00404AD06D
MAGDEESVAASKNQKQDQSIDHGSPYYLHPSDYPRQMQVNDLWNGNNCLDWFQEIERTSWVAHHYHGERDKGSVRYAATAEEIWIDLRERFRKESAPRAYELKQLLGVTKQDGTLVSAYYTRLRVIWDEIRSVFSMPKCSCGGCKCGISKSIGELRDKEKLYELLLGLDSDYSTIRTQILSMKLVPSLREAFRFVSEDE